MARMVVGLGNPGPEYEYTRHNAGFMTVELLGERLGAAYWKEEAGARTSEVRFGDEDLLLVLPQSYVNRSGRAVERLAEADGIDVRDIIVVHDDIDIPVETVRAKDGGGHGGHNGLRSISDELGSGDYARVRLGVGRPPGRMDPADYVLEPMRGAKLETLESTVPVAAQCVVHILEHGIESAMREFNAE
jgi:PTH1 family peptidyl-tRNA hydrolase